MYLNLFLVALVSFAIPSCAEDYSDYKEEFEMAFEVQNYQNKWLIEGLQAKVEKGENLKECVEILEKAKKIEEYRAKAFEELKNDKLEDLEKPNLKSYVIFFKKEISELKNHETATEENSIKIEKLLDRLEFYKNRDEKIYRLLVMTTYLELERECIKIYTNQVIALHSLKHRKNVKVNQEHKMVLKSEMFDPEQNHLEYDSVRFFIDGIEKKIAYSLKFIGGIGILKFTPNQVGVYSIKGKRYLVSNSNPSKRKSHFYFYQKNVQK